MPSEPSHLCPARIDPAACPAPLRHLAQRLSRPASVAAVALLPLACGSAPEPASALPEFATVQLTGEYHGEGASAGDFNNDGVLDIVSGAYWYEGPKWTVRHPIYPPVELDKRKYSDNFFAFPYDINGDDWLDVLFVGFPGKAADWYENPGARVGSAASEPWQRHRVFEVVDNESPTFADLDGDGRPELICMTGNARRDGGPGAVRHPVRRTQLGPVAVLCGGPLRADRRPLGR